MSSQSPRSLNDLRAAAVSYGLLLIEAIRREEASVLLQQQRPHLAQWQARGFAGEMGYMQRDPALFTELERLMPDVRSLLFFTIPYSSESPGSCPPGHGKIARYAWGRDYHLVFKERLRAFAMSFWGEEGRVWRAFTDAVPLLERPLAARAGLGFVGRNSLAIHPSFGSYFFLGELLLSEDIVGFEPVMEERGGKGRLAAIGPRQQPGSGCGSCQRCLERCPTQAFSEAGVLDARLCISYLTIEKRGAFSRWERRAVGSWLFGCDVCQEVCPFNATAKEGQAKEFGADQGIGPFLSLRALLTMRDDEAFRRRFAGTPLLRAKREGLLRNACAVSANARCFELVEALAECLIDVSPLIRHEARAALENLELEADGLDRVRIEGALRRSSGD